MRWVDLSPGHARRCIVTSLTPEGWAWVACAAYIAGFCVLVLWVRMG